MSRGSDFDSVTLDELRRIGGVKWSAHPGKIGAFVAEMDFGTAPVITKALHGAVDLGVLGYLPTALSERMSQACADWSRAQYGWEVSADRIRPLPDVLAGLMAAIRHFTTPDSPVILPTPAYMPFLTVPAALGRQVIEVPMRLGSGRYTYDLEALEDAFRAGGNLLVLCNPHNPTGRVLEREEMLAVSEVVERHGGRVFSDEIHAPLVYPGHRHVPYASVSEATAAHTLTATSASKAWNLPGLKCAQLILSNDADAMMWAKVGRLTEHGASNLGVVANIAAYSAGEPWLAEVLSYLDANRRALAAMLAELIPAIGYVVPEGTYLAWLDCRGLPLGDHPSEYFLAHADVAMTNGSLCGQVGHGFVRLNIATPRPILEKAVDQMAGALADH